MNDKRQASLVCLVGATGSGKSTIMLEMLKSAKKNKKHTKFVGFDPHDVMSNFLDHFIKASDEQWATRISSTRNGRYSYYGSFLILDDYRALLKGNNTPKDVLDLLMLRRKISIDIMYATHNPKLILERFSYYTNIYMIFYTESNSDDFSDKIPKYYSCQKAAHLINSYVSYLGGVDSDAYRSLYPNFPYIIVNTKSNTLELINIDKNVLRVVYN